MKNSTQLIIVFATLIGINLQSHSTKAQNLIVNGGLETAVFSGWPYGVIFPAYPEVLNSWSAVTTDGEFMFDTTGLPHTGTGFMSVLQNAGANMATNWLNAAFEFDGYDRAMQLIPVEANKEYTLKFWVRSGEGLRYAGYGAGTYLVQVEQFLPSPEVIGTYQGLTTAEWEDKDYNFVTGSSCTKIAILFSGMGSDAVDVWVDDISLYQENESGIENASSAASISVYPNPASGQVHLQWKDAPFGSVILKLVNAFGQVAYTQEEVIRDANYNPVIPLNVPPGMYLLQIIYNGNNLLHKNIMVQ